jgi:hypothetical protein
MLPLRLLKGELSEFFVEHHITTFRIHIYQVSLRVYVLLRGKKIELK